jgi:hypothetical protein
LPNPCRSVIVRCVRREPAEAVAEVARSRRDERPRSPPLPPQLAVRNSPASILALHGAVGNAAVCRMLADEPAVAEPDAGDEAVEEEAPPAAKLPIGDGHNLTFAMVDGEPQLGMASDFQALVPKLRQMVKALLSHPTGQASAQQIGDLAQRLTLYEASIRTRTTERDKTQKKAREKRAAATTVRVPQNPNPYEPARRHFDRASALGQTAEKARTAARDAQQRLSSEEARALSFAKDALIEMWDIGRDFLPVTLMPVGKVFEDRPFRGDTTQYRYFTGKSVQEAIPITWYKRPEDYPDLLMPDGTVVRFGDTYTLQARTLPLGFGGQIQLPAVQLGVPDRPRLGWIVRKTMHDGDREGQVLLNRALNAHGVQVLVNGTATSNPLSAWGGYDGDHVRDLGFEGVDDPGNYWPLEAHINRRAFTGYNTGYVINYKREDGSHASRSIGGLVGHYFRVVDFLDPGDGPVPTLDAASNGVPANAQQAPANAQPAGWAFDPAAWIGALFSWLD